MRSLSVNVPLLSQSIQASSKAPLGAFWTLTVNVLTELAITVNVDVRPELWSD